MQSAFLKNTQESELRLICWKQRWETEHKRILFPDLLFQLKRKHFLFFFHFKGCSKVLNFLPIYVNSLSNICSTVANFPAKRFGKNLVLNTYAPIFFLFFPFFNVVDEFTNKLNI